MTAKPARPLIIFLDHGAPEEVVMEIAGHVDRRMLKRYSHVRLEAKRKPVEVLSRRPSRPAPDVSKERCPPLCGHAKPPPQASQRGDLASRVGGLPPAALLESSRLDPEPLGPPLTDWAPWNLRIWQAPADLLSPTAFPISRSWEGRIWRRRTFDKVSLNRSKLSLLVAP